MQGIEESWGTSSNEIDSVNILNSISLHKSSMPIENALRYSFDSPCDIREKMCRYLLVQLTCNSNNNCLASIEITRWL